MKKVELGATGIEVSELCFGTLTASPIQTNLPPAETAKLIKLAVAGGVNFIDTAQGYKNYEHVRLGISGLNRMNLVIATKSAARTGPEMQAAFEQALAEIGIDYIDIFILHAVRSEEDFQARQPALKRLLELKSRKLVRAVGVSGHGIAPIKNLIGREEIDVCHPIFNKEGLGIKDGDISEMSDVLSELKAEGKGVYAMKPLGGGRLARHALEALNFARRHEAIHSVAVGMKDAREVAFNLACFEDRLIPEAIALSAAEVPRKLHVNFLCRKCGVCVDFCEQGALRLGADKAEVDMSKCVLCGYCVDECPEFAIRII